MKGYSKLKSYFQTDMIEAGCDEAGRGCLAGPVFAAAVILPRNFSHHELNDSKKLNEKQRNELRFIIEEKAIAFCVSMADNKTIDRVNILNAAILAMHKAIEGLAQKPGLILVDGNRFKRYRQIPYKCIVGGDAKYYSIAAASILAKTYRDEYMKKISAEYPVYEWYKNKGYPTKVHRQQIANFGVSPYHRKTFKMRDSATEINFENDKKQK